MQSTNSANHGLPHQSCKHASCQRMAGQSWPHLQGQQQAQQGVQAVQIAVCRCLRGAPRRQSCPRHAACAAALHVWSTAMTDLDRARPRTGAVVIAPPNRGGTLLDDGASTYAVMRGERPICRLKAEQGLTDARRKEAPGGRAGGGGGGVAAGCRPQRGRHIGAHGLQCFQQLLACFLCRQPAQTRRVAVMTQSRSACVCIKSAALQQHAVRGTRQQVADQGMHQGLRHPQPSRTAATMIRRPMGAWLHGPARSGKSWQHQAYRSMCLSSLRRCVASVSSPPTAAQPRRAARVCARIASHCAAVVGRFEYMESRM